jgi:hypothetical protein
MATAKKRDQKHPRKTSSAKKRKQKINPKYKEKIIVDASFEELMKELATPKSELKEGKKK